MALAYNYNDRIIVRFETSTGPEWWPAFIKKVNPATYVIDWSDGSKLDKIRKDDPRIVGKVAQSYKKKRATMIGIPESILVKWMDTRKDRKVWIPPKRTGKAFKPAKFELRGLMEKQKADVRSKGKTVTIKMVKGVSTDGGGYQAFALDSANDPITKWHKCAITGIKPNFTSNDNGLKVSCGCERFMFHHEYALHYHGMSHIIYSNGEPPTATNPRFRASLDGVQVCKHLYALAVRLIRR